ncbi:hypothetical protein SDC9_04135 [bioreactor metagenome]|uniref:Phage late control D family protein n=1 Tax=bioreactor metagenome TaxID=1076179 RepID=A0A644SY88_9ZZZZ|nr:hypothetical protein [Negativicutes bacterium]
MKARRAKLQLKYNNADISEDLERYLISFSYTDNASGKADDLQITLEDRQGLWKNDWFPEKGATLEASIITSNWEQNGNEETLPCGTFEIDEIECSGSPETVTIKAVSVPESSSLRGEVKTRAWEKTKLSVIANDIASGAGLKLIYDTEDDPGHDRIEQIEQSDLSFLQKLCDGAGLSLKVTDQQIVIFDDSKYEQLEPVMTIKRGVTNILRYSAISATREIYSSCLVKYHNSDSNDNIEYLYVPPNRPATGKKLVINEQVASVQEAEKLAKKRLRQQNKEEVKVSMTLLGKLALVGGVTVLLEGFGVFDGKYFTEQASHSGGSGYTTQIDLRRVLEGY